MTFHIAVSCIDDSGATQSRALMVLSREDVTMETLGLTLAESKQLLHTLQQYMVEQQATAHLEQHCVCPRCGSSFASHGQGRRTFNTVVGSISVPNPRWWRCECSSDAGTTFRPAANWLIGRSSPELQYLETKWASLIPYAKEGELLTDVLPVSRTLNPQTVCNHLQAAATKLEQALDEEQECLFSGLEDDWATQPLPDGPMTVGLDGGMVRAREKARFFEVIAGKSIVGFTREEAETRPSAKRFAFVQTYDTKPRRRVWELMKSQGMQENQQVLFLSDGGDTVRNLQVYLHPYSEHVLDWVHVTMRLTVMNQQTKGVAAEDAALGAETTQSLESMKHYLWHGNVEAALERLECLSFDLDLTRRRSAAVAKLCRSVNEFDTYIRNNRAFIPNYGERYRQRETISTAFVESTINQVVSRRFVKKPQMHWTRRGAHLLLQTRTKVLNAELEDVFRRWYPLFRIHANAA